MFSRIHGHFLPNKEPSGPVQSVTYYIFHVVIYIKFSFILLFVIWLSSNHCKEETQATGRTINIFAMGAFGW
jgi:uncharacterized membrane protein